MAARHTGEEARRQSVATLGALREYDAEQRADEVAVLLRRDLLMLHIHVDVARFERADQYFGRSPPVDDIE